MKNDEITIEGKFALCPPYTRISYAPWLGFNTLTYHA